jgi:hypothetical protein
VAQGTSVLVRTDYVAGSDHRAQPREGQTQAADAPRMVQIVQVRNAYKYKPRTGAAPIESAAAWDEAQLIFRFLLA